MLVRGRIAHMAKRKKGGALSLGAELAAAEALEVATQAELAEKEEEKQRQQQQQPSEHGVSPQAGIMN